MPKTSAPHALMQRRAGVVLHPTSLPGPELQGVLGADAFRFVDFLRDCGLSVWQLLPLGPTHADRSPYMSLSVHAGNPLLICCTRLREWGWISDTDLALSMTLEETLAAARRRFMQTAGAAQLAEYTDFLEHHQAWLDDFALYIALRREHLGLPWTEWPAAERNHEGPALAAARERLRDDFEVTRFTQFVFFRQWYELRDYANRNGVLMFGDMPIFVAHDSAEVWAHREYFDLDERGQPRTVAGVPPDYFSATGQRWGNPHYRWEVMRADGFRWWIERLRTARDLYDLIRIDHFRGFEAYWEIPAQSKTAMDGRWVKVDGEALFDALLAAFHDLPLVAEDLGIITPEVEALREKYSLPGMKILQFAFDGGADNPYLPENYQTNHVVYTGTHDNDTTLGWYEALPVETRVRVDAYLGEKVMMPWSLIECALASSAQLAMFPMQDLLGLGGAHRMNTPGVEGGNWQWRFAWDQVPADAGARLRALVQEHQRI